MKHPGFPSEETLTAFINHKVDDTTRHRVIAHMPTCKECYETWTAAKGMAQEPNAPVVIRGQFRKRLFMIVAAVAAAIVVVLLTPIRGRLGIGTSDTSIEALVASAGDLPFRTVAPRLSKEFDYRPLQEMTRSGGELGGPKSWRVAGVAANIKEQADATPTAENLHALGLSYLILGHTEQAIQTLEQANVAMTSPAILSDLAAAYYAAGVKQRTAGDIARSLQLSDSALAISSGGSLAAQFNRSLALEALANRPSALAAWQRYLQLDGSSEWAAEARQHASRLSAAVPSSEWASLKPRLLRLSATDLKELSSIAIRFPLRSRRTVENELLPRWARACSQHDEKDAALVLAGVEVMGAALEARFGDPTLSEIARTISAAAASGNRQRLDSLTSGYLAYAEGRTAIGKDTIQARASFRDAWKMLREPGSPSAYAAGMSAAVQEYERRDYDEALRLLAEMKSESTLTRYPPLAGQVLWVEGMVLLASGRPHESLQRYREAARAFQRSGEIESVAAVDGLIAENLQALGDDDEAWKHRLRALPVILDYADARRQQVAFNEAAEAAMQQDRLSAALDYQTSSVALATSGSDDHMAAYSYLGRALILSRKGQSPTALGDVERARTHAGLVSDLAIRKSTAADVDMAEALLRLEESPSAAIPLFTRVLDYQHEGRYEFRTAQLLLARGRAHARLGNQARARADFSNAIAAVESQREQVSDLRLRSAFFGRAEDAYEELTALLVRSGELDEALSVFDRSCERTLTEIVGERASSIPRVAPQTLSDGTALVEIAVLPDEIVAWTMRRSRTSVSRHRIPSREVGELAASYERAIAANSAAVETIGSKLYDILIRPLGLDVASEKTVTFIVDRGLSGVPLASLYDRSRKRYLVEDFAIATAPSAGVYWHCSVRLAGDPKVTDFVAIGNAKASALALGLPDLPEAERELTEIASRSRGRLLLNERATPRALLAAAAGTANVHFAGHALVNQQDRGRSALVLSPDGEDSSTALLYADEIAGARLRAPLVVLSACTTNSKAMSAASGAVDVARAFLAAGVPTVVTSRWEVADGNARDLLTRFVRALAGSVSPAEALRHSQLEMLRQGDPVRSWCAFEVVGAV